MARTYPQELRDRVLAAYDRGMQTNEIAELFDVSPSWARRLKQVRRETGRTSALPRGGARFIKIDLQRLQEQVQAQPDATLKELGERLQVDCWESSVHRALLRLDLTLKKRQSMPLSKIAPTSRKSGASGKRSRASTRRNV